MLHNARPSPDDPETLSKIVIRGKQYEEMVKTEGWNDLREYLHSRTEALDRQCDTLQEAQFAEFKAMRIEMRINRTLMAYVQNVIKRGQEAEVKLNQGGKK